MLRINNYEEYLGTDTHTHTHTHTHGTEKEQSRIKLMKSCTFKEKV